MDKTVVLKDGRTLGYAEYGDPKGSPLFFFHGWPSCRYHAERFEDTATDLKIRLISVDRPGVGNSDFQKHRTLLDWPDDVAELARSLNIKKFSVVGVSGGGPYAAVCAFKIPKLLHKTGIVVGLAPTYIPGLLDSMGLNGLGWRSYAKSRLLRDLSTLSHQITVNYLPFLISILYRAKADKELMTQDMHELYKRSVKEGMKQCISGLSWDLNLYTHDWGFDLKQIKSPVYLWYGNDDKNVTLTMGKYFHTQIPNSKLTVYPHEGHLCQITHAREILLTLTNKK